LDLSGMGKKALKIYFEGIEKEGTEYLYESKLLIIGEGGVGKTSFAKKLQKADADLPKGEDTTLGIDVYRWSFDFIDEENNRKDFKVNIWDFAGQPIYQGTHQIFFCEKTLYVFLDDTRKQKTDFSYWLNSAEQFAGEDSSIVLIFNKMHGHSSDFDKRGYMSKFGHIIKDVIEVDLNNKAKKIIEMQEKIKTQVRALSGVGMSVPGSWKKIREELAKIEDDCLSFEKFKEICTHYNITSYDSIHTLSSYYNRIGVFTHFIDDDILHERIYLNSNWLLKTVYKVLDDKIVKEKSGELKREDLNRIWKNNKLKLESGKLARLMHNFGLMYYAEESEEYIVPAHLKTEQPYDEWKYEKESDILTFVYEFDKYEPKGLMPRIIVSLCKHIEDQSLVWRRGFNLKYENTFAEILETYETKNRFRIRIWGANKVGFLAIIRNSINQVLNKIFKDPNYKQLVPCICSECKGNKDPHSYKYIDLQRRKKNKNPNAQYVQCERSFENVSVKELLQIIKEVKMRKIKIFLASSNELATERERIEIFISRENKKYFEDNIFLELVIWEDLKKGFQGKRYQDYLNEEMLKCNIVISMFFTKVGDFTKEEFDVAYKGFKEGRKPNHLYVYFKQGQVNIDDIDVEILNIKKLKDKIKEAEQIFNSFDSTSNLILQLTRQFELIVPEIIKKERLQEF